MEAVIDRILAILEAKLPALLTKINTQHQASDVVKFGVALTLAEPDEYLYGATSNLQGNPSLQVYCPSENVIGGGYHSGDKEEHTVYIEVCFWADQREVSTRMLDRYRRALMWLVNDNMKLADPDTGRDELATWGNADAGNILTITMPNGDPLFEQIQVIAKYHLLTHTLDLKLFGA